MIISIDPLPDGMLKVTATNGRSQVIVVVKDHDEAADRMPAIFAAVAALSEPTPEPHGGAR